MHIFLWVGMSVWHYWECARRLDGYGATRRASSCVSTDTPYSVRDVAMVIWCDIVRTRQEIPSHLLSILTNPACESPQTPPTAPPLFVGSALPDPTSHLP